MSTVNPTIGSISSKTVVVKLLNGEGFNQQLISAIGAD
jgi:hypothetical protein